MPPVNIIAIVGTCIFLLTAAVGLLVLPTTKELRNANKLTDSRTGHRFGQSEKVILSWRGADEVTQTLQCRLIDISEDGLRVRSKLPLALGMHMCVNLPRMRLATTANVRRCAGSGWKFDLGLEF